MNENVPVAPVVVRSVSVMVPLPPSTFAVHWPGLIDSSSFDDPVDVLYVPMEDPTSDRAIVRLGVDASLPVMDMRSLDREAVTVTAVHEEPSISAVIVWLDVPVVGLVVFEPLHAPVKAASAIATPARQRMYDPPRTSV